LVDLPGAYGMDAYTNDELEATDFLKNEKIDAIINVVDASNLERSLLFSMQLIETGIPVVIALNKSDITHRRKTKIDIDALGILLNTKIHFTQATRKKGLKEVVSSAIYNLEENNINGQESKEKRRNKKHYLKNSNKRCGCE